MKQRTSRTRHRPSLTELSRLTIQRFEIAGILRGDDPPVRLVENLFAISLGFSGTRHSTDLKQAQEREVMVSVLSSFPREVSGQAVDAAFWARRLLIDLAATGFEVAPRAAA